MTKTLITGANGFIGSRLCSKLSLSGRNIKKLVRTSNINDSSEHEQLECDLGRDPLPKDIFEDVESVFHLVGVTHDINNNSISENTYYDVNVLATEKLALSAVKNGVKRFIYVSSVKAGGSPVHGKCMAEDNQEKPEGIYGETKRQAEIKLLEIGANSGMHVSIIRPALVYGPEVKGNLRKMLHWIEKGWFPPLPEIGNRRSMIHVEDLVDIMLLVEKDNRSNGEIFIATDGYDYSSSQIYKAMCKSLDIKIKKWVVPNFIFFIISKIGDIINIFIPFPFDSFRYQKLLGDECFSSKKIHSLLGFNARYNLFSEYKAIFFEINKKRS
jgi:UDP-glucose 4-epimerase